MHGNNRFLRRDKQIGAARNSTLLATIRTVRILIVVARVVYAEMSLSVTETHGGRAGSSE
jgi:hypothetical protein